MGKTTRKLLAFLLVLVMLFAASATTVAAATTGSDVATSAGTSTGSTGSSSAGESGSGSSSDDQKEGKFDLGWFTVEYVGDDVFITVDSKALYNVTSLTKEDVKQLIKFVIDAVQEVVLEDFVVGLIGTDRPSDASEFIDLLVDNTIGSYIDNNYGEDDEATLDFLNDIIHDDAAVEEFADFLNLLVKVSAMLQMVADEEYPVPADLYERIEITLSSYKDDYVDELLDEQLEAFKQYTTGTSTEKPVYYDIIYSEMLEVVIGEAIKEAEQEAAANGTSFDADDVARETAKAIEEVESWTEADYVDFFASDEYLDAESNISATVAAADISAAFEDLFNVDDAEFDARILEVEGVIIDKYTEVYQIITEGSYGVEDLVDLISMIDELTVNGLTVYGDTANGKSFVVDALVQLVKDFPTLGEIAEMKDGEMQLTYSFGIFTDIGDSEFNVTFKFEGHEEELRKVVAIIDRNLQFAVVDGEYVLKVNVPDELAKAALKACQSDRVPDSIKTKVFAAFSTSVDEMYAFVNNVTFDDLMKIFDYVDFDEVLDSEFVSKFEQLDGLTEAEIQAKVEQYADYYDLALKYLAKAYSYVPESIRGLTLMDFYKGNGTFAASVNKNVDLYLIAKKFNDTLGNIVDTFIDDTTINVSARVEVTFNDVYKVSYYVGNDLVREGFLPVGANVDFFSGVTTYDGMTIVGWVDAEGNAYTEMPAKDVDLYAVAEEITASLTASATEIVYGDGTIVLTASALPYLPYATYTYTWYKNNVVVEGANESTLVLTDVADSGEYHVVVTADAKSATTEKISITINPKQLVASDLIEWNYTDAFGYDGTEKLVEAIIKGDYAALAKIVAIDGNKATDAGTYTATVTLALTDPNYAFDGGNTVSIEWTINPKAFTDADVEWNIPENMVYAYGTTYTVTATYPAELKLTLTNDTYANAGTYVTTATVEVVGGANYVWAGSDELSSGEWTIAAQPFDLSTLTWIAYSEADENHNPANFNFTYTGNKFGVKINNAPADIDAAIVYSNASATDAATSILATAELDLVNNPLVSTNYAISGTISSQEWSIAKAVISTADLEWTAVEFIYNTTAQVPVLKNFAYEDIVLQYVYEKYDDANGWQVIDASESVDTGIYRVTVTVNAAETPNFVLGSDIGMSTSYAIKQASINVDFSWSYTAPFTYTGSDITIYLDTSSLTDEELALLVITGNTSTGKNAGDYTATATIKPVDAKNYVLIVGGKQVSETVVTQVWTINKALAEIGTPAWDYTAPVEYTGAPVTVTLTGLSDKVYVVYYAENEKTNAGTYIAQAVIALREELEDNYYLADDAVVSYTTEWKIVPKTINLGELTWNDFTNPTYTGQEIANPTVIIPTEYAEIITATYVTTVNGIAAAAINAGTYVTTVSLNAGSNYTLNYTGATKEWKIERASLADYLASLGIAFNSASVQYDNKNHSILVTGTLPSGVTVTYEGNDQKKVGTYTVTAKFTSTDPNYTESAELVATLTISYGECSNRFETDNVIVEVGGTGIDKNHVLSVISKLDDLKNLDLSALVEAGKIATLISAYDVEFMFDGAVSDVNGGQFTVKILIPEAYRTATGLAAIYVNESGAVELLTAEVEGDYIVFNTDHFSIYGIINITDENQEPTCPPHVDANNDGKCDNCGTVIGGDQPGGDEPGGDEPGGDEPGGDEPDTPSKPGDDTDKKDNSWIWIVIAIILVLVIAILILFLVKRKGDDEEPEQQTESDEVPPTDGETAPVEEEPVVEEAPVEPAPVEEAPVEETPVEEAPATEPAPVEEAPAPVEEPAPAPAPAEPAPGSFAAIVAASADADAVRLVNGVIVPVRYRTSFMSRLIQAEPPIQDYYTVVKNNLLSYKGVKARTSWNFESFNKGRIQCAKLNVKGNAFQVYLGLDPNEYNVEKYHFVDVGDKPKLDKVPMMLKVKSDRSLKYVLELIEEVMKKNEIVQGEIPNEDYHLPYESTEALVDRDLVKVILPDGMEIDENTIIERVDVGNMLASVKPEDDATAEETPVVEAAPVVEEPKVHIVDHQIAEEEIVNVDAIAADEIVSDEQAKEFVQTVARTPGLKPKSNKLYEVNLDTICENFDDGDVVTIDGLKSKNIITKKADRIKVLARGVMTKKLTVVADKFSIQAIKMIGLAGGLAQKYKD